MNRIPHRLLLLCAAITCASTSWVLAASETTSSKRTMSANSSLPATTTPPPEDLREIKELLDTYTSSVSSGNRGRFEQMLLDEKIPFYGLGGRLPESFTGGLTAVQNYASFRRSVFESGAKLVQTFSNVKIDQDGDLAQVSLNFETRRVESGGGGRGWKVLQLLKVKGHWKIASEFYTVYPIPAASR